MTTLLAQAQANPFDLSFASFPLLSLVTFLPLLGAILIAVLPNRNKAVIHGAGIFVSITTFLVSIFIWRRFRETVGFQLVDHVDWIPSAGVGYTLGVDGISLLLVLLTTLITPIALAASTKSITHRVKEFVISILVLETGMLGALLALDLFLFYVFWEAMLIPMYLLIGIWGGKERLYATMKFFLYTMVGSVLMLVGIIYIYLKTGPELSSSLSVVLDTVYLTRAEQLWLFSAFGLAFAIKVPLFPLHTWLPDAHTQAPTAGSVILAAILLKIGTYGFLRFAFPMFPEAVGFFSLPIIGLAVFGIVYGALVAYNQTDVKKLVAYSSVSHLGFVVLGMFVLTKAGVEGAILQMVNHGISTGGLFLCVGILYERRHTRMIADYGGIAKQLPVFATFFMIMTLSSIGLPGTNGFVGEFTILAGSFQEAFQSHLLAAPARGDLGLWEWFKELGFWLYSWRVGVTIAATLATLGVVLGAIYMLSMYRRVMFGPLKNPKNKELEDLSAREVGYLLPLAALVFLIGFFPNVLFNKMHPSVEAFVDRTRPVVMMARSPETVEAQRKQKESLEKKKAQASPQGGR